MALPALANRSRIRYVVGMGVAKASRGRAALAAYIERPPPRVAANEIAAKLGVTAAAVRMWATGVTTPGLEYIARMEEILGIAMRDWAEPAAPPAPPSGAAERPRRKRARSAA